MFKTISNWRRQREIIRELSRLSNRDLADIGIARSDMKMVARQATLGGDANGAGELGALDTLATSWGVHNQRALAR